MARLASAVMLCASLCACSSALLMDSGNPTGGTIGSVTTSGTSTSGGTGGFIPVTVMLEQMQTRGCFPTWCDNFNMGTGGLPYSYPNGVSLQLAGGGLQALAHDFDCPPGATAQGRCCLAPATSFPDTHPLGCFGDATASLDGGGSLQTNPETCEASLPMETFMPGDDAGVGPCFSSPAELTGTTAIGFNWSVSATLPADGWDVGTNDFCPTISVSQGATFTWWYPSAIATTYAVILDATFANADAQRIVCAGPEDAGALILPAGLVSAISEATSITVRTHHFYELLVDAGVLIDIRAETTANGFLSDCQISP
jgi:hypothetical protein